MCKIGYTLRQDHDQSSDGELRKRIWSRLENHLRHCKMCGGAR